MKARRKSRGLWCLRFLMIMVWVPLALASEDTPMTVTLELSYAPDLHQWAVLTTKVQSIWDAPNTYVELVLPAGAGTETTSWVVDLKANTPVTLTTGIVFHKPGNLAVNARARKVVDSEGTWGGGGAIALHISPKPRGSQLEWKWDIHQPGMAVQVEQGDTNPTPMMEPPLESVKPRQSE